MPALPLRRKPAAAPPAGPAEHPHVVIGVGAGGPCRRRVLLACGPGVHVDFHAHRHFNDLRCSPSHTSLHIGASSHHRQSKTSWQTVQAFTSISKPFAQSHHCNSRTRASPARLLSSLASKVPSRSWLAALKRRSTTDKYSSSASVPSRSGSAVANSLAVSLPPTSRLSRVPS